MDDVFLRYLTIFLEQGTERDPLVIKGSRDAVISAFSGDRNLMWNQKVVDIRHSWITLEVKSASLLFGFIPPIGHNQLHPIQDLDISEDRSLLSTVTVETSVRDLAQAFCVGSVL